MYLSIAALCFLVWGKSLSYQFVWDDIDFIERLPSIRSLQNLPSMFLTLEAQAVDAAYYKVFRPLRTVVYALLYTLGGRDHPIPWIYHLNNVLWHTAAAMLLVHITHGMLIRTFGREASEAASKAAWFAGAAFAVHPVVSETVCWAKALDDLMATVFILAATRYLLRWTESRRAPVLAHVYFALAAYSKVSAVPFGLFALPLLMSIHGFSLVRSLRCSLGFHGVALFYLVHRHLIIGQTQQIDPLSGTYVQTLIDMLPVVTQYARLLCGIPPFIIDYSFMTGGYALLSAPVLLGASLLVSTVLIACFALRSAQYKEIGLGMVWIGAFMLPVSNLLPMMQYMAERFLYLPLVGWMLAVSTLLMFVRRPSIFSLVSALLLICWSTQAFSRASIWKDNLTLFVASSLQGPQTKRVEQNAVRATMQLPHMRQALKERHDMRLFTPDTEAEAATIKDWTPVQNTLNELKELYPSNGDVSIAIGIYHARQREAEEAFDHFLLATQQAPENASTWASLGHAYMDVEDWPRAASAVEKAIQVEADSIASLKALGRYHGLQGHPQECATIFHQITMRRPDDRIAQKWRDQANERAAGTE